MQYIKSAQINAIKIINSENQMLEFEASKQQKEKLLNEVLHLDEVQ